MINHTLPNVAAFVRTVLKREKLSDEAECLRAKYEETLNALEQGRHPPRPVSFIGDDDSGYFSANRPRGGRLSVCVLLAWYVICLHSMSSACIAYRRVAVGSKPLKWLLVKLTATYCDG